MSLNYVLRAILSSQWAGEGFPQMDWRTAHREWWKMCGDRSGGFFVLATALPGLAALGEDAGEQLCAGFVARRRSTEEGQCQVGAWQIAAEELAAWDVTA